MLLADALAESLGYLQPSKEHADKMLEDYTAKKLLLIPWPRNADVKLSRVQANKVPPNGGPGRPPL